LRRPVAELDDLVRCQLGGIGARYEPVGEHLELRAVAQERLELGRQRRRNVDDAVRTVLRRRHVPDLLGLHRSEPLVEVLGMKEGEAGKDRGFGGHTPDGDMVRMDLELTPWIKGQDALRTELADKVDEPLA